MRSLSTDPTALIAAARAGDEAAFDRLISPFRRELHAHCYRMLGSVHDADDALQDALLRTWRGLGGFGGRSSLRVWLFTIATNSSLDTIRRRAHHRVLPLDHGPPTDPSDLAEVPLVESAHWIEPYPEQPVGPAGPEATYEQREGVELAFIAALQHLPANQRAVLILREVLGFSAQEVADSQGTSVASVKSALQRARRAVDERLPARSQQATLRAVGDERTRALVDRYMRAMEVGDVNGVVALLTEDAVWSMPPFAAWFRGLDSIVGFLEAGPMRARWRFVPVMANGQLALGCYWWRADRGAYVAAVLDVLTLRDDRIAAVTAFVDGALHARFGLPGELEA